MYNSNQSICVLKSACYFYHQLFDFLRTVYGILACHVAYDISRFFGANKIITIRKRKLQVLQIVKDFLLTRNCNDFSKAGLYWLTIFHFHGKRNIHKGRNIWLWRKDDNDDIDKKWLLKLKLKLYYIIS